MSTQTQNVSQGKWKLKVPSAFTILFIVLILAVIGTWLIPSGSYAKLKYDTANKVFIVKNPQGESSTLPATKETLDNLKVSIELEQFTGGKIRKPISIPETYERLQSGRADCTYQTHQGTRILAGIFRVHFYDFRRNFLWSGRRSGGILPDTLSNLYCLGL